MQLLGEARDACEFPPILSPIDARGVTQTSVQTVARCFTVGTKVSAIWREGALPCDEIKKAQDDEARAAVQMTGKRLALHIKLQRSSMIKYFETALGAETDTNATCQMLSP
eukprot:4659709-Amphidinium_carterae.2